MTCVQGDGLSGTLASGPHLRLAALPARPLPVGMGGRGWRRDRKGSLPSAGDTAEIPWVLGLDTLNYSGNLVHDSMLDLRQICQGGLVLSLSRMLQT